jgi:alanine racemase
MILHNYIILLIISLLLLIFNNKQNPKITQYFKTGSVNIFDQIKRNIIKIKSNIGSTRFGLVIKYGYPIIRLISNMYGYLAVFDLAKYVESYVDIFYVANIYDGINLRKVGIKKPIMVLYLIEPSNINLITKYDLEIIVPSLEWLSLVKVHQNQRSDQISGQKSDQKIKAHLWLNSNLGKEGANTSDEVFNLYQELKKIPYIKIIGLGTKYNTSDLSYFNSLAKLKSLPTDIFVQHKIFSDLVKKINNPKLIIHTACTFEVARNFTESYFGSNGAVRVGTLAYRNIVWKQKLLDIRSASYADCYGYYCERTAKSVTKTDSNTKFKMGLIKNYLSLQTEQMNDLKVFDSNGIKQDIVLHRYDPITFKLNPESNLKIGSDIVLSYNDLYAYK